MKWEKNNVLQITTNAEERLNILRLTEQTRLTFFLMQIKYSVEFKIKFVHQ